MGMHLGRSLGLEIFRGADMRWGPPAMVFKKRVRATFCLQIVPIVLFRRLGVDSSKTI